MHTFRAKVEVLNPSATSLLLSLGALIVILLVLIFSQGESFITSLLIGRDATEALQARAGQDVSQSIKVVFGNQILGRAVVFGAWAFVGFMTLTLITVVQSIIYNVRQAEAERSYVNQDRQAFTRELLYKFLLRLGLAVIWGVYTIVFLRFVVTFFVAAAYVVTQGDTSPAALSGLLVASVVLISGVHLHVVLARLFAGRVRIWGD